MKMNAFAVICQVILSIGHLYNGREGRARKPLGLVSVLCEHVILQEGTNTIEVAFESPVHYALKRAAQYPYRCVANSVRCVRSRRIRQTGWVHYILSCVFSHVERSGWERGCGPKQNPVCE